MNSETQPNAKASHFKSSLFTFFVSAVLIIGIAFLNRDTPQFDSLTFLGASFFMISLIAFVPFSKRNFWSICVLLVIVSASIMAVLTKEQNPQVSSTSFLSALFITFGMVAAASMNRLQLLLYKLGYRASVDYSDATIGYSNGSPNSGSNGSWGSCGGGSDGGGDCGS